MNPFPSPPSATRHRVAWRPDSRALLARQRNRVAAPLWPQASAGRPSPVGWPWLPRELLLPGGGRVREVGMETIRESHWIERRSPLHLHFAVHPLSSAPLEASGVRPWTDRSHRAVATPRRWAPTERALVLPGGSAPAWPMSITAYGVRTERSGPVRSSGAWLPQTRVLPSTAGAGADRVTKRVDGEETRSRLNAVAAPVRPDIGSGPADVNRIADQVMRTLDRRLTAYRERKGRTR